MRTRYAVSAIAALAIVGLARAQTTTTSTSTTSARPAAGTPDRSTGLALLQEVTALQQLGALQLTSGQRADIRQRLAALDSTDTAFIRKEDNAARSVGSSLARIRAAIVAGKAPAPADVSRVTTAMAPTQGDNLAYSQLRQTTIDAIRLELTRAQLDLIRVNLGMAPVGQADWGPLLNGPAPGSDWYPADASQFPAQSGIQPSGLLTVMDTARTLPILDWERQKDVLASQAAVALGAVPGTPYAVIMQSNMSTLLNEIRQVPVGEYQAGREALAMNLASQAYAMQTAQANQTLQQAIAASVATDEDAVSRFFLREEVLKALRLAPAR